MSSRIARKGKQRPKKVAATAPVQQNILKRFLDRVRTLPTFWDTHTSQTKPSWYDDPRLLKPYQEKRASRRRTVKSLRRTRAARGQNLRTGSPA